LKYTLFRLGVVSNPVPVIVTDVPEAAAVGVKLVIVGAAELSSANCWVLVVLPAGEET
jgi:hypothetical protein